jgi:pyridoxamine 5'-phosphate oxidase
MNHEPPLEFFHRWYVQAQQTEPRVPDAMQLATVDSDGRPWVRTVLMKGLDEHGLLFFTNYHSPKGVQVDSEPRVSLCFHWKDLARQVLIGGVAHRLSAEESRAYFNTRPRGSQIGAWASNQSKKIDSREALHSQVAAAVARFENGPVPCPPQWGGYRVVISRWEFWQDQADRLHDRFVYEREGETWRVHRVQP